ncbi:MAG TPA: sulfite exporter TauE/SafE family protein [Ktedonobacteraceae bacterium]|jgi:hypothetical protein|nr:sulfite exporter TauE/SafE family protein [Ktedonobacteraceae bacterium]
MTFPNILLLFVTAVLGGTLNSVAGGGSFFTFPALLFTNMPGIPANATSTVALWPGSIAGAVAYRNELAKQQKGLLLLLIGTSLIGGILGALLLLYTPQSTFVLLIPYLLLLATLLFTFSGPITARLRKQSLEKNELTWKSLLGISILQLVIATYGGYFGGGIGILMLASLALMGLENIHVMNALKTVLASCINGVAVVTFIIAGIVSWPQALLMIVGGIIGGYGGAYYARKIDPKWVRLFVMVIGFALTIYFFVKYK